jgi:hypothetical protein
MTDNTIEAKWEGQWQARLAMPTVASQMPLRFDNGTTCSTIAGQCDACGHQMDANVLRGRLVSQSPQVIVLEAAGTCPRCDGRSLFDYAIHDDGRIERLRWGTSATPIGRARVLRWVAWGSLSLGALSVVMASPQTPVLSLLPSVGAVLLGAWLLLYRL